MASLSKTVRPALPSLTKRKLSTLSPISIKLGSRSYSNGNAPGSPTMYDLRKLCHNLSQNTATKPCFETLKNIPSGVFRNTNGEILGLGAGKDCPYKNPEYFSFHHTSFYDLNLGLRQYRKPCPKTERKPN